jgi:hypothetical protein
MLRLAVAVLAIPAICGCRVSLDNEDLGGDGTTRQCIVSTTSQPCLDAATTMHPTLGYLEQNVFAASCLFSGCHNGPNDAGKLDLSAGKSHAALVGVASRIDPARQLIVPADVASSFLMLMVRDVPPKLATPPADPPPDVVGYMPPGSAAAALCCQKLDALERWIDDGAPNN